MSHPLPHPPRYGIYLTPDPDHLTADAVAHLRPVVREIGATWVVLPAHPHRAVPEALIAPWVEDERRVLLHLRLSPADPPAAAEMVPLFRAYARWGVQAIVLGHQPNRRARWGTAWTQGAPPQRTADALLPLIHLAQQHDLLPLLPPLAPGGDYWDTAFLRALLEELLRRDPQLPQHLGMAVSARTFGRPLTWGQGGPERWPEALPYHTPPHSEDQRGFCTFDWYAAIARAVCGQPLPMFLLPLGDAYGQGEEEEITAQLLAIAHLFGLPGPRPLVSLPEAVFGGAFWVLTAPETSPHAPAAWLQADGTSRPILQRLRALRQGALQGQTTQPKSPSFGPQAAATTYVLLPPDPAQLPWALEVVRPLMLHLRPTLGFDPEAAAQAQRVLLLGGEQVFDAHVVQRLRQAGCRVYAVRDGTDVATLLAEVTPTTAPSPVRA